jgi:hypothetical protein
VTPSRSGSDSPALADPVVRSGGLYADGHEQLKDGVARDRRFDPDEWPFWVVASVEGEDEAFGGEEEWERCA